MSESNNKSMCSLGWEHLHVAIDGKLAPCCIWDYRAHDDYPLYNLNEYTLEEALNSPGLMSMRKAMMNGESHPFCSMCDRREADNNQTMRNVFNIKYMESAKEKIEQTREDGFLPPEVYQPKYIDVRFSNLCNLKCRMCSHQASSSWYDETLDWYKELEIDGHSTIYFDKFENNAQKTKNKIEDYLQYADSVYFAGGEPLILEEHYQVLNKLIEMDKAKDIELSYNTNLSVDSYKGVSVIEYWKHFKSVKVMASVDGMNDVFEYIRTGGKWSKAKEIFERLRDNSTENVKIEPCFTVSLQNLYHMPEFIKWCHENEWLHYGRNYIGVNFVEDPVELNIPNLPQWAKDEVNEKFEKLFVWLRENRGEESVDDFTCILNLMNNRKVSDEELTTNLDKLKYRLHAHDITAGLDWQSVMPEIKNVLSNYNSRYWDWQTEPKYIERDR